MQLFITLHLQLVLVVDRWPDNQGDIYTFDISPNPDKAVKRHQPDIENVRIPLGSHLKVNRLEKKSERKERKIKKRKNSNKFTVHVYEKKIEKITVEVQMSKINVKIWMSNEEEGNGRIPKLHKLILKNFAVPSEGENCLKSSRYKKKKN